MTVRYYVSCFLINKTLRHDIDNITYIYISLIYILGDYFGVGRWRIQRQRFQHQCVRVLAARREEILRETSPKASSVTRDKSTGSTRSRGSVNAVLFEPLEASEFMQDRDYFVLGEEGDAETVSHPRIHRLNQKRKDELENVNSWPAKLWRAFLCSRITGYNSVDDSARACQVHCAPCAEELFSQTV